MHPDFWQTVVYLALVYLMAGYTLLDGYDLGVGVMLPFFPRRQDKRALFNALAPFWDGNEVWLIISAGTLFALFPMAYATVFTGFYVYAILILLVLVLRATSFEFWFHSEKYQSWWEAAFCASSLMIPVWLGMLAGNVVLGVPLAADFRYTGNPGTVFRVFPVITAFTGLVAMIFQGMAFMSGRSQGELQANILRWLNRWWWVYLAAAVAFMAAEAQWLPWARTRPLFWSGNVLAGLSLAVCVVFLRLRKLRGVLLLSSLTFSGLWIGLASAQYPVLVRSLSRSVPSLDITNTASSHHVLQIMAGIMFLGMVPVIAYTWYVHRVFRTGAEGY